MKINMKQVYQITSLLINFKGCKKILDIQFGPFVLFICSNPINLPEILNKTYRIQKQSALCKDKIYALIPNDSNYFISANNSMFTLIHYAIYTFYILFKTNFY